MILAVLQARVSSSRLPGKVLMPILGEAMLLRQIERVTKAKFIDKLIVATSTEPEDDSIANLCDAKEVFCYRGSLDDVLDRFYQASRIFSPEHVVRLTGDCPLADSQLIDAVIQFHLAGNYDYSTNALEPTFPDGLDVEVIKYSAVEIAWNVAKLPSEREHVTLYINQQPGLFKIGIYKNDINLSHLRWTVDEPADYELVNKIYNNLYPANHNFSTNDILKFLQQNPSLQESNTQFKRNEGMQNSLLKDTEVLNSKLL